MSLLPTAQLYYGVCGFGGRETERCFSCSEQRVSLTVVARCSYRFGTVAMETTGLPACIDRTRQRWEKVACDWIPWPPIHPPTQQHLLQGQSVTLYCCQHIVTTFFFVDVTNMSNGHNLWAVTDLLEFDRCRVAVYISYPLIIGHAHLPKSKEEFN